jgi:hypothetical protein
VSTTGNSKLTPESVSRLRADFEAWKRAGGNTAVFVRTQADAHQVGIETLRRALRGETFRKAPGIPQGADDSDTALAAASAERLRALLALPQEHLEGRKADEMMGELANPFSGV